MTRQLLKRVRKLEATALALSSIPVFRVYSHTGEVLFDGDQHLRALAQSARAKDRDEERYQDENS